MPAHHSRQGIIIDPIEFYSRYNNYRWYIPDTNDKFATLEQAKTFIDSKLREDPEYFSQNFSKKT